MRNDLAGSPDEVVLDLMENSDSENEEENHFFKEQSSVEDDCSDTEEIPIPRGKSVAHHYFIKGRLIYCSFDVETGGEYCGIVQISAEIFRIKNGIGDREAICTLLNLMTV